MSDPDYTLAAEYRYIQHDLAVCASNTEVNPGIYRRCQLPGVHLNHHYEDEQLNIDWTDPEPATLPATTATVDHHWSMH